MNSLVLVQPLLSIDEHVFRISNAINNTKRSMFELVQVVKNAHEQLGDGVFGKELAEKLNMSPSTLSKWKNIGESGFLSNNQDLLPNTFSTLYELTKLEKKYVEEYGNDQAYKKLQSLIDEGRVSVETQQSEIQDLLNQFDRNSKAKNKKNREDKILKLVNKTLSSTNNKTTLNEILESGEVFKTFVVTPSDELLSRWGDDGYFDTDIFDEFPLVELRSPSLTETLECFIVVPAHHVGTGIKILSGFGFNYRDLFVPNMNSNSYHLLKNEKVLLRGERGSAKSVKKNVITSLELDDLLKFAEEVGSKPNLLVFNETEREEWSCLVP